ncbi:MAG: DUF3450 domain-containing protein [Gammaproteobacteria bacterium]
MRTMKVISRLLVAAMILTPTASWGATVAQLLAQGESRADAGARAQRQVENAADAAVEMLNEYKNTTKVVDGLKVFNGLLQKQVDNQEKEKAILRGSLLKIADIEKQIVPLMVRMIDGLEDFVKVDIPFLPVERSERLARLRSNMEIPNVSVAEKFRTVLEAYDIETEYGRTIEAYNGALPGTDINVDFLRVGRVALMYQNADGSKTGAWDKEANGGEGGFVEIPNSTYQNAIRNGLKIAKKDAVPDLLMVPIGPASASE